MKCCICKKEIKGYGNNADPLAKGLCCDECNQKVIEARIKMITDCKETYVFECPGGNAEITLTGDGDTIETIVSDLKLAVDIRNKISKRDTDCISVNFYRKGE